MRAQGNGMGGENWRTDETGEGEGATGRDEANPHRRSS